MLHFAEFYISSETTVQSLSLSLSAIYRDIIEKEEHKDGWLEYPSRESMQTSACQHYHPLVSLRLFILHHEILLLAAMDQNEE
jgi:hypothetical protein